MPNPLSWWFHHLPRAAHRVEVLANHATQLVVPVGLFLPQPVASAAGLVIIVTQGWLLLSGNFAWLNALTIVLAASALDDRVLDHVIAWHHGHPAATPAWFATLVVLVGVVILALSWWPARNLVSRQQRMNASFNRLHLVNTYGAFGSVTRVREELVIEGSEDAAPGPASTWRAYEFKGKPTDPSRRPRQVAPYHLRLDWLLWFVGISPAYGDGWLRPLLRRLLEGDAATLRLLARNPFPDRPPAVVRVRVCRYRFTTRTERRSTGRWWERSAGAVLVHPVSLASVGDA